MASAGRIVEALGRPRTLETASLSKLRDRVRRGLPFSSLQAVSSSFRIDRRQMSRILDLPMRTLARRKKRGRLGADESDRLFRLARIATLAEETLGSRDKASGWLHDANQALGGERPLEWLDTDAGAREVENLLVRIAHGVYS